MTNDVPDQIWAAPGHDCPWNEGVWDLVDDGDENALFLRATPARLHAEELLKALEWIKANTEWAEEGREKAMVANHCHDIARAALAHIEGETP